MRERDKHFALAVDEIVKGIDEAFAQKPILGWTKKTPRKGIAQLLINLINIFK
ncbi:hypothetical protein SAMN02745221_01090 [Thermosyntropha lipolytica DSM 11003]|uniref:Uncharacterized protein n=1 Tax=Thermosyntropha lipolytica DSM 11003 TaxID=1123382 RepID=A0A1M5N2Z0_9FIRM|nr:hypothetical protein [Thermosyntropha lipolytica]SHG83938.1 hypothetical protein SAMN02745221_01090 [Thermosyntropha lipolytica DSM 11003]